MAGDGDIGELGRVLWLIGHESRLGLGARELVWFDTGSGQETLVLIHGWCCDASFWGPFAERLSGSRRLVSLDLAGHGSSSALDAPSVTALAADVRRLLEHLDLRNVSLIGHSLGGAVALEAAIGNARVTRVIGVDTFTDAGMYAPRPADEIAARSAGLAGDFPAAITGLVKMITLKDPTGATADAIAAIMAMRAPGPAIALMADLLRWDLADALARYGKPLVTLNSAGLTPLIEPLPASAQVAVVDLDEVGHFPMVEAPFAFAQALERVLAA